MTALEYKKDVRRVMDYALAGGDINALSQEDLQYLKYAVDNDYLEGIILDEMITRIVCEERYNPRIKLAGLEFLDELAEIEKTDEDAAAQTGKKKRSLVGFLFDRYDALPKNIKRLIQLIGAAIGTAASILGILQFF